MNKEILDEIALAQRNIDEAEHALEAVLAKIEAAPRADKVTVGPRVEEAFDRLRAARAILTKLNPG